MKPLTPLLKLKWQPSRQTLVALVVWLANISVLSLGLACRPPLLRSLFIGLGAYYVLGIAWPCYCQGSAQKLGCSRQYLLPSLAGAASLTLLVAAVNYSQLPRLLQPAAWQLLPLVLAATLFEVVFFRGYLQNVFVQAWGPLPAIFATGACFALFHLPYPQWSAPAELLLLFSAGSFFSLVFQLTGNIFILWPLPLALAALVDMAGHDYRIDRTASLVYLVILLIMGGHLLCYRSRSHRGASQASISGEQD